MHGLAGLPHDSDGDFQYTSEFELIAPAKASKNSAILIEAENRGSPVFLTALQDITAAGPPSSITYPEGFGNGFLFEHDTSYARVQWQTALSAGVPKDAQGVGEVILRDFARMLAGRFTAAGANLGTYHTVILGGISQSGFFVNTFIAEGFNADPATGRSVFDGAIAVDGIGNWLALNQLAAQNRSSEFPYVVPNGVPLQPTELLKRPQSDPFYIDTANYTDFYRLRASLTDGAERPGRMRRYDWPGPHGRVAGNRSIAGGRAGKCEPGDAVELNPLSYTPYLRAITIELEHTLGVPSAKDAPTLPQSTLFELGPAPNNTDHFNPLPGQVLRVPRTDEDDQPIGGVRFPEVTHPLGRPVPVSLAPAATTAINQTCGNLGGWQPFSPEELSKRYGDQSHYLQLYGAALDNLIAAGYLLPSDRAAMLQKAASLYASE